MPDLCALRACCLNSGQVGDHLIGVLGNGNGIVDFDMRNNYASTLKGDLADVSRGLYFDDLWYPDYLYATTNNGMLRRFAVNRCKLVSQERPTRESYSWTRAKGYGCEEIDDQPSSLFSLPAIYPSGKHPYIIVNPTPVTPSIQLDNSVNYY